MNPPESADHLRRARLLYDARKYDLAIRAALDAIAADPDDGESHVILALSYERVGKIREAEAAARRAVELDPDHARAHIALGITSFSRRRFAEALRIFAHAASIDPLSDDAFRLAGIAQMNQGHYLDAERWIRKALEIDPDVVATHEVLAITLRQLGRADEAEAETALVLRMNPESALGLSQAGALLNRRGESERARATYLEALRIDPTSVNARSGLERLILERSPIGPWTGPRLALVGIFCLGFLPAQAVRISTDLALASIVTGLALLGVNRALAVVALRRDPIGRTFVTAVESRFAPRIVLAVVAAEFTIALELLVHRPSLFVFPCGLLFAAYAYATAMRADLPRRAASVSAASAAVVAVAAAAATIAFVLGGAHDHAAPMLVATLAVAILAGGLALAVSTIVNVVFVIPRTLRALGRLRRR